MKRALVLFVLVLAGCARPEDEYIGGARVLKDTEGCVFIARARGGSAVYVAFSPELSEDRCRYGTD